MTHKPERDIEPAVADWFRDEYGPAAVETQVYLSDVRWFCDITVDLGFATLYVEVENDARSVRPGVAQAAAYAGTDPEGIPLVVTPVDHVDTARRFALDMGLNVLIREFDTSTEEFITDHE